MSIPLISERTFQSREFPPGVLAPMNALLFGSGEQGVLYDPSDLSALFQDAAGTTPVTAMEQPVGRMLDLSGNGNHASQATTTKRGVVSRRVNLIANTEFAGAVAGTPGTQPTGWTNNALTGQIVSATGGIRIYCDGGARRSFSQSIAVPSQVMTYELTLRCTFNSATAPFNLVSAVSAVVASTTVYLDGVAFPGFGTAPAGEHIVKLVVVTNGTAGSIPFAIGVGTGAGAFASDVTMYSASVALATDSHLPYQWVNTATNYDDNAFKFPTCIKSDGIDDSYSSATGGGGNAGFFFSQAITVLGGAGTARTLFSDAGTNTGYRVRLNASNQLELAAGNGTAYTTIATAGTLAVGTTDVVQAWDDGTNLNVKIGTGPTASVARPAVAAGTAGYTMGQDNGASTGYFNGRIYSTVYRKDSAPTQVQREAVAALQRQKARMP